MSEILTKDKQLNYITALIKSIRELQEQASQCGITITFDNLIAKNILKDYEKMLKCLKTHTMHINHSDRIDSHKIAALFLVSILKNFTIVQSESRIFNASLQVIPYIHLSFIMGIYIMESMYNADEHEKVSFKIDMKYAKEFVKLIYANQATIVMPAKSIDCNESYKSIFCLSHLFYFIEKSVEKVPLASSL